MKNAHNLLIDAAFSFVIFCLHFASRVASSETSICSTILLTQKHCAVKMLEAVGQLGTEGWNQR